MLEANWFIRFAARVQEYVLEESKWIKIAFGSVSWTFTRLLSLWKEHPQINIPIDKQGWNNWKSKI